MNLQELLSYVRGAVEDYDMIAEGDRICVGLSGGKDSLSLLMALSAMRRFYPKKYELYAVTVSLGFPGFDIASLARFCDSVNVRFEVVETDIADVVFNIRKEKNPCSLCANMRRGALNNAVKRLGCNKAALGHNRDDAIETFFLSLFYGGRARTFQPVTYLDRTDINVIRPLIYAPEDDLRRFVRANDIKIVTNPCPADGNTKREHIKMFVKAQNEEYENFNSKMMNAIRELWNQKPTKNT
jgi:tRNA(Ile)-lysidine synthase TilS/MesJ